MRQKKKFDERVVEVSLTRQGRLIITEMNDFLNKKYRNKWNSLDEQTKKKMLESYETMVKLFTKK